MLIMWTLFLLCCAVFIYHHALYPLLLKALGALKKRRLVKLDSPPILPRIGIIMCAYNEQRFIRAKLDNLAILDYPANRFDIHVGLDGCTDNTEPLLDSAFAELSKAQICCFKHVAKDNIGKIRMLNTLIQKFSGDYDILLFTDVSALLSINALQKIAHRFNDPSVGVVSGNYQFLETLIPEQQQYWQYQNDIKSAEGALGAVIGVPGAMYAMRADLVSPIPASTINDDFVLPMTALNQGYQAVVEPDLGIVEMEADSAAVDRHRRVRIGAGNIQQLWLLRNMLSPKRGWSAFNFLSGKALRAIMPIVLLSAILSLALLSFLGDKIALGLLSAGAISLLLPTVLRRLTSAKRIPVLSSLVYMVINYGYALWGVMAWFGGKYNKSWCNKENPHCYAAPFSVRLMKRTVDITASALGLLFLSPLFALCALAIKLTSSGPIFYKQLRVGFADAEHVTLIRVIKFRTMVVDAEKHTGAVWAKNNDPRITPLGAVLRKTRIDELPQLWNVLVGDMSLVGPRPERPCFHQQLESNIPMFCERTVGLKPGITGLAQVQDAYPNDLAGMRKKLAWDMAYSLAITTPWQWLKIELAILIATIKVVILAKGN